MAAPSATSSAASSSRPPPVNLTERQKELLRELDESLTTDGKHHNPNATGWLDAVKSFYEKMGL